MFEATPDQRAEADRKRAIAAGIGKMVPPGTIPGDYQGQLQHPAMEGGGSLDDPHLTPQGRAFYDVAENPTVLGPRLPHFSPNNPYAADIDKNVRHDVGAREGLFSSAPVAQSVEKALAYEKALRSLTGQGGAPAPGGGGMGAIQRRPSRGTPPPAPSGTGGSALGARASGFDTIRRLDPTFPPGLY